MDEDDEPPTVTPTTVAAAMRPTEPSSSHRRRVADPDRLPRPSWGGPGASPRGAAPAVAPRTDPGPEMSHLFRPLDDPSPRVGDEPARARSSRTRGRDHHPVRWWAPGRCSWRRT